MTRTNVLLVAKREMLQILKLRSFWLTLLILPVALALGPLLGDSFEDRDPTRVTIIDRSGGARGAAIEAQFAFDDKRRLLSQLSRYVRRHDLQRADPKAPWAQESYWYGPADIAAFEAAGGVKAALATIAQARPEGVPDFEAPKPDYSFAPPPPALADAPEAAFEQTARRFLAKEKGDTAPDIIVLVPKAYPADTRVAIFAGDDVRTSFVGKLQEVLTADLRMGLLAQSGVTGERAVLVQTIAPTIAIDTPPPGGGASERMLVRSIVPLALAYILMMSLMLSGSWMLQGSVEERSNKLIESLLACISPEELMYGKLAGGLAVGLMMITVWAGCAGVAAFATQGTIAEFIRPALEPVSSPGIIAAILFFFIAGYIAISAIFVAIGSMADSMSEAQGFMMPVLLLILLPITYLLQAIIAGNSGPIVQILTWVPLWTPFAVLARLGQGIATWELIGTGLLMVAAITLELVLIGRLFRASLLATGQRPTLAKVLQRLRRPAESV
jgi:ABC-2 type transport system permease protein